MGLAYNPRVIADGLVLYLDAANPKSYPGTGTTWQDMSGNNISGSLINGPTFSASPNSIVFDGTNDYVACSTSTALNNETEFSVGCFFKTTAGTTERGLVSKGTGFAGVSSPGWSLRIRLGVPSFAVRRKDGAGYYDLYSGTNVENNNWYYAVGTFNTTQMVRYLNGAVDQSMSTGQTASVDTSALTIGVLNSIYFNGSIACVQVYNRALTQAEVQQNYTALKARFGL